MANKLKSVFGNNHGLDDRMVDYLMKALVRSNLPGFDYLEFKQSLAALAEVDLDEPTRYKSAFAAASAMGLTKEKLVETAGHYKEVVEREKQQFLTAMKKQVDQKITGKQQEVERMRQQIVQYQEKIQQLQAQIQKFQTTIDGADQSMQAEREKIQATKDAFDLTHQSLLNQMNKDIENINIYL